MSVLSNVPAERAVLAGICQYGSQSYLDVADILQESSFTVDHNKFAFACLKHLFKGNEVNTVDLSSILSAAHEIGLETMFESASCQNHIRSFFNFPVSQTNVRRLAAKIRKLEIARLLKKQLGDTAVKLQELNGDETLAHILGIAENAIFDFSSLLNESDEAPHRVSDGLIEYVQYLADNPVDQVGISTGFPIWDASIGGGLRKGTVNVIGARIKTGKSMLGSNMGYYIADTHNIPVLNLDTEMTKNDHINRLLSMASEAYTYEIETGKFVQKPHTYNQVKKAAEYIDNKKVPYYHKPIAGMPFEDQLAILRRWVVKEVGLDGEGKAKPCVLVYDYLKLMTSEGMGQGVQEHQLLGFMMSSLHNFAVRYDIPILLFVQLNRAGIDDENSGVVSGSDRIGWLCTSLSLFKKKGPEEINQDGPENGNRKLMVIDCRHGPGRDIRDYINCYFRGDIAKVVEGKNNFQVRKEKKEDEIQSDDESEPDFSGPD